MLHQHKVVYSLSLAFLAPETEASTDISEDQYLRTVHERDAEREHRYGAEAELARTKAELANTKAELDNSQFKLAEAERTSFELQMKLVELRTTHDEMKRKYESTPWTTNAWDAAQNMSPGAALIATVAAPVMTVPLAAATVVKGFQAVGTGIGTGFTALFQKKVNKEQTAASEAPGKPTSTSPNPESS